jgi:hypothetical protein
MSQGLRAEVYALQTLILGGILWLCLELAGPEGARRRTMTVAGLGAVMAVGMANHHYLTALALPAVLVALSRHLKSAGAKVVGGCAIASAATTLALYAYLPLRAADSPALNWGDPSTFSRWLDAVSAKIFQSSVTEAPSRSVSALAELVAQTGWLAEQVGPWTLIATLVGLALAVSRKLVLGATLGLFWLGNMMSTALMGFDSTNPDAWGYLGPSVMLSCVLSSIALARLKDSHSSTAEGFIRSQNLFARTTRAVVVAVWLSGSIAIGTDAISQLSLRRFSDCDALADATFAASPPGALVGSRYFSLSFNLLHAQVVDQRRPDVLHFNQTFHANAYGGVPYARALAALETPFTPIFEAYLRTGSFPSEAIAQASRNGPVLLESEMDPPLPAELYHPMGTVARMGDPRWQSSPPVGASWARVYARLTSGRALDRWTNAALLWLHAHNAGLFLRQGAWPEAQEEIALGQRDNPRETALVGLSRLAEQGAALSVAEAERFRRSLTSTSLEAMLGL